jgi:hypothetical protein
MGRSLQLDVQLSPRILAGIRETQAWFQSGD